MRRFLFKNAQNGERERQRIRQEREATVRRTEEIIAHSKELLRQADMTLARVLFSEVPPSPPPLRSCGRAHDYWLYVDDKQGRLIGPPVAIPADDDLSAIVRAQARLHHLDAELRDGARLVKRLDNDAESPSRGGDCGC